MNGYVNTDASYELGVAALAYESRVLGRDVVVVKAQCSTEAELMALRMAMAAASNAGLDRLTFRVDSSAAARPEKIQKPRLLPITQEIMFYMQIHERWRLVKVPRRSNVQANCLARKALRAVQPKPHELPVEAVVTQ